MKPEKMIKRVFALEPGERSLAVLAVTVYRDPEPTRRQLSRLGCVLQRELNCVRNGKRLSLLGRGRERIYVLEPAMAAAKVRTDAFDAALHSYHAAPLFVGRRLSRGDFAAKPAAVVVMDERDRPERIGPVVPHALVRPPGESLADYATRVRPLLAPEQLGRPTERGHNMFCIDQGWNGGRDPRPISWELYEAAAMWVKPSPESDPADRATQLSGAACAALTEARQAVIKWPAFASVHEGHAEIREEFDELWAECVKKELDPVALRKEAVQLTAMGLRFIAELTDREGGAA